MDSLWLKRQGTIFDETIWVWFYMSLERDNHALWTSKVFLGAQSRWSSIHSVHTRVILLEAHRCLWSLVELDLFCLYQLEQECFLASSESFGLPLLLWVTFRLFEFNYAWGWKWLLTTMFRLARGLTTASLSWLTSTSSCCSCLLLAGRPILAHCGLLFELRLRILEEILSLDNPCVWKLFLITCEFAVGRHFITRSLFIIVINQYLLLLELFTLMFITRLFWVANCHLIQ